MENMLNAGFLCTIVLVCENWSFFFFFFNFHVLYSV